MKRFNLIIVFVPLMFMLSCGSQEPRSLDISGIWTVALDSLDKGLDLGWNHKAFDQTISLPGTTDEAGLGKANELQPALQNPKLLHLTRKHSYIGAAWYTREIEIPSHMKSKSFILTLERVIWQTEVWVDGEKVSGVNNSLVAPHCFDLTDKIHPGRKQRLTVKVDNRRFFDISHRNLAHAYTDHTQTIWNGIIGGMKIEAVDGVRITSLTVKPDIKGKKIAVRISTYNSGNDEIAAGKLLLSVEPKHGKTKYSLSEYPVTIAGEEGTMDIELGMGNDMKLWDEFNPELYMLKAELTTGDTYSTYETVFGLREVTASGNKLMINSNPMFLRGTLECNIFPLLGHPPMTLRAWDKLIATAKEWGLNHLRFHSWCPPKAAFEAADKAGFYLQVELPAWTLNVGKDQADTEFMYAEGRRIIKEYGNHPSFCFMSMGNELQGDMRVLAEMTDYFKALDNRRLYTNTSFTFEKGHGTWPEPNDDFFITQWTKNGWVRGQGVFNSESPSFDKDYSMAVEGMPVPLVTHEIGQYAVYPNLAEIPKYTGALDPLNFKSIEKDLREKGLLHKAGDYMLASGKLAAILYKEEIERSLKTAGISGFQLLDLHDFPGQGTALVGLLDAFWDSKGILEAKEFSRFCSSVVPLLRFPKAVYTTSEHLLVTIELSNYSGKALGDCVIEWVIKDAGGNTRNSGEVKNRIEQGYNGSLGKINVPLGDVAEAQKLTIALSVKEIEKTFSNSWNIWVYPDKVDMITGDVLLTGDFNEAMAALDKGRKVLLVPDHKKIRGVEGKFVPVFWSPVHFPKQAGTMGLLCNPSHPAFADFPTGMHTDWQWWDICINSTTMVVDSLKGGSPIVEVIDNFANNRRLAMIYEGRVGTGKLVIASCDLASDLDNRPVARQMLSSLLGYMNSGKFDPSPLENPKIIRDIILPYNPGTQKSSAESIYSNQ